MRVSPSLPDTGFLRLSDIVGRKATKKSPAVRGIYPVSRSTWWQMVRDGRAPAGLRLSKRCTAWRVEDVIALCEGAEAVQKHMVGAQP